MDCCQLRIRSFFILEYNVPGLILRSCAAPPFPWIFPSVLLIVRIIRSRSISSNVATCSLLLFSECACFNSGKMNRGPELRIMPRAIVPESLLCNISMQRCNYFRDGDIFQPLITSDSLQYHAEWAFKNPFPMTSMTS